MNSFPPNLIQDEHHLGELAMKFRATRRDSKRRDIAKDYSQTVTRLIQTGRWRDMPPLEDQLPDDWMPAEFIEFWSQHH
jgi:hypothetical protein